MRESRTESKMAKVLAEGTLQNQNSTNRLETVKTIHAAKHLIAILILKVTEEEAKDIGAMREKL